MSVDEKQALERLYASKPARLGLVERIEFEHHRHGTLYLIANFEVATGKIISPTLGPTRTEANFAAAGRPFFSDAALRPHKSQYWLTSQDKRETPAQYQADVERLCDTYRDAPQLAAEGTHVVSVDEKQALERLYARKPARLGLVERIEFEHHRHGTLYLIANFEVATGKIISPTLGPTRTEANFAAHIEATIETDPDARWIFVADQLDTHRSATLVELVAQRCGIKEPLGIKGKTGIFKSKQKHRAFLQGPTHQIRFVYTPRHCSWLKQVEIWFSILARRLLKRASFTSLDDLRTRVLDFIDYFNNVLGRPFRWTYTGRPLQARFLPTDRHFS